MINENLSQTGWQHLYCNVTENGDSTNNCGFVLEESLVVVQGSVRLDQGNDNQEYITTNHRGTKQCN